MKNLLFVFCAIILVGMSSCGGDDCAAEDWVGTYTLQGESECVIDENTSISASETLIIAAGTSSDLLIEGDNVDINQDNCSISNFITILKDGDELTSDLGSGCVFVYKKN